MASKAPKKKESKDQVPNTLKDVNQGPPSTEEKPKKKPPIPIWAEWSDQDIANEKWDLAKKEKDRGRSPNASVHYFDDPEGRIELPSSLDPMVHMWKRPSDIVPAEKIPVIVDNNHLNDQSVDLLSSNEHLTESELMCTIISSMTSLFKFFAPKPGNEVVASLAKLKVAPQKEAKDSKAEKVKKELEPVEEPCWRPWDLIWPKESVKPNSMPVVNSAGKYAVKLYWMGAYRKIVVDDTIPCDAEMKPLLPLTTRGHELWPLLITKALIKVASLDYFGGSTASEIGDVSIVHCLTGWLPEPIPLEELYTGRVWNLLLKLLPNWKLPKPPAPTEEPNMDRKNSSYETDGSSKQDLSRKDSKEKAKQKEDATTQQKPAKESQKQTTKAVAEKADPRASNSKDNKAQTASATSKAESTGPYHLLYATFSNMPTNCSKISELKDLTDASERLRQFGLSNSFPHPVHLSVVRNSSLIPPPTPVQIPRWKLIRQKKKKGPVEPSCNPKEIKEPKFLELQSPFFNFRVSPTPTTSISATKWDKFKLPTPMESVCEESIDGQQEQELLTSDVSAESPQQCDSTNGDSNRIEDCKSISLHEERSLSFESQANVLSPTTRSARTSRTSEAKKSILKERKQSQDPAAFARTKQSPIEVRVDNSPSVLNEDGSTDTAGLNNNEALLSDADVTLAPEVKSEEDKKDLWMDFEDFFHCFSTLWIFHKPKVNNKSITEIKSLDSKSDKGKKNSGHSIPNAGRNAVLSPTSCFNLGNAISDTPPPFLLVDCLEETEVVISLQSFSRWFDPNLNINKEDKEALRQALTPVPGSLVVEPSSWKQIVVSSPLMKIRTTGIRCAVLTLPPGRHVLRLMITAPLGYNVHICSTQPFVFGDEHSVMQNLTKESLRFIAHGVNTMQQLGGVIRTFIRPCEAPLTNLVLGTEGKSNKIRQEHFNEIFKSFAKVVQSELATKLAPQSSFAIDALKFQAYFHLKKFAKERTRNQRPYSTPTSYSFNKPSSFGAVQKQKRCSLPIIHFNQDCESEKAARRIQAPFRGYYTRKLMKAHQQGTPENTSVVEQLNKIWAHVEANMESIAVSVYRTMFIERPSLFSVFPFYTDEWNKISFTDYSGSYPEQPPDTWFVICREIFFVQEPLKTLPKFYCNAPRAHLKVIDNDTGAQVQTVFHRVVPQVLQKNKLGYTFIATSFGDENAIPSGKFRLRVLGEREPLPCPLREAFVNSHFFVSETKDYYIPNQYSRIFRYSFKTSEDLLASVHFFTSKDDVYVKIQILDNEEVLYETEGKKFMTVSAQLFLRDRFPGSNDKKSPKSTTRTGSGRSSGKASAAAANKRPISSRNSASPDKNAKAKALELKVNEDEVEEEQIHKYIIQGYVLRNSWPLTKQQWDFVETLKSTEEDENSSENAAKIETAKNSATKSRKGGGKDSKGNRTRPESQTQNAFDVSQPHWTLKVVVDSNMESAIEVKRDTKREDEIRSIKKAWEIHEPGRAAKAQEARAKYLEAHTVVEKKEDDTINDDVIEGPVAESPKDVPATKNDKQDDTDVKLDEVATEAAVTSTPTPVSEEPNFNELFVERPPKDTDLILQQFDITPFLRSSGKKVLLDQNEEERMRLELEKKFQDYNQMRDMVLSMRENDRLTRNAAKERQLAEYESMQLQLDKARSDLYKAREEFKNKLLPQQEIDSTPDVVDVDKKKRTPSPAKRKPSKMGKSPTKAKKK